MQHAPSQRRNRSRLAFTLIELVVVISIIVVLLSLAAGVFFRVMLSQQASATVSAVTRVQKALSTQYQAVKNAAEHESLEQSALGPTLGPIYSNTVLPMAAGDKTLARVIWVKLRLKQAFPTTFAEALNPSPLPSLYKQKLAAFGVASGSNPAAAYESSACLLLALQRSVSGGVPVDQISQLSTQQVSTGSGTIPVLMDTYNTPLAFCRWPTGTCLALNLNGILTGTNNDPEDPHGLLTNNNTWLKTQGANTFMSYAHPVYYNQSYKLQPIVVSAGQDLTLGLDTSSGVGNTPTFNQLSDNANDDLSAQPNP
jgi:prepilin-type N-terminal cleavage/methylation domain-containing protein